MNRLKQLERCGQSLWLDYLRRDLIEEGELLTLVERDGLKGVTSNPSIFEKAIAETELYANALKECQVQSDHSVSAIYEELAIADIRAAADVLRPVYDLTERRDGYVSLECSPYLADSTEATVTEALRLRARVSRSNLMIKVAATPAGIPAIRELTGHGVNVNVTLLFSVKVYEQVVEAYISGLEDLARLGGDVSKVASVASLFVSRVDTAIDKRLDRLDDKRAAGLLRGKIGIANAKLAYADYKMLFSGPRWQSLVALGAKTQRLLWASTGVKDPAYKDTKYVEALIGRDTVNTVPRATMEAFRDHGEVKADLIEQGVADARAMLATLKQHGISLNEVTEKLTKGGVQQFTNAFDKLFGILARRRQALLEEGKASLEIGFGSTKMKAAIDAELEVWRSEGRIRWLWAGDRSLSPVAVADKCVAWLHITESELADVKRSRSLAKEIKQRGFSDVVLMGIGGPSLGPEVVGETFGQQVGGPRVHIPGKLAPSREEVEGVADLPKTLFIVVSSTSSSTLALNIFAENFFSRIRRARGKDKGGEHILTASDAGSWLEDRTKQLRCADILERATGTSDVYAVREQFGLVAAPAIGLDIKRLYETTRQMERACGPDVPPVENPGVQLGIVMGIAASRFGRDKVTIIASPETAALGAWLQQLLAESLGKVGRRLIAIAGEPQAPLERYGSDRLFVFLELDGTDDPSQHQMAAALSRRGHPFVRVNVKDIWHIGQEFFRWEFATAVAYAVIFSDLSDRQNVEAGNEKRTS
jgi:transaldolase/glucose-6-phosphate isomerase